MWRWLIFAFFAALVLIGQAKGQQGLTMPTLPQGRWSEGHEQYHEQFKQMYNQNGTHCCSDGDCSLTQARYDAATNEWYALVEGRWTKMGASRWVQDNYGVNVAFVCFDKETKLIWCFSSGVQM